MKRYELVDAWDSDGGMRPADDGDWVDADEALAKLAEMTAAKNKALEALKDCVSERGHVAPCCVNYNHADEKFCDCGLDEYKGLIAELERVK